VKGRRGLGRKEKKRRGVEKENEIERGEGQEEKGRKGGCRKAGGGGKSM